MMTPKTLRTLANMDEPLDDYEWFQSTLFACAAAWEACEEKLVLAVVARDLAEHRLEAAESTARCIRDDNVTFLETDKSDDDRAGCASIHEAVIRTCEDIFPSLAPGEAKDADKS